MKKIILNLLMILCVVTTAYSADQVDVESFFRQANTAFSAGTKLAESNPDGAEKEFNRAALLFRKIIDSGVHNDRIYYNLGNCYYRTGDYARAILAYQRGLLYDPSNEMIKNNLSAARKKAGVAENTEEENSIVSSLQDYQSRIALTYKEYLFYASYAVFWVYLLGMLIFHKRIRKKVFVPLLAVWVVSLSSVGLYSYCSSNSSIGVVLAEDVTARKGDGVNYAMVYNEPLKSGMEFRLLSRRGEWSHIQLADGADCWVQNNGIGLVCEKE